jgi:hypothetical protein
VLYNTRNHTYIEAPNGNPKPILVLGRDNVLMASDCVEIEKILFRGFSFRKGNMSIINVERNTLQFKLFFFFLEAKSYNV